MIILVFLMAAIGWLCGVWMPWWVVLLIVSYLGYILSKSSGGLADIPLIIGLLAFSVFAIGGLLYSGETFNLLEWVKVIFTGGN